MSQLLQDRRVLLTGASRGVGFEIARFFLQEGARIIGASRDEERLLAASVELKKVGEFHPVVLDLRRPGVEREALSAVGHHFGGSLDVLFNNAGIMIAQQGIEGEPAGSLEESMQVNVLAAHNLIRVLLPALLEGREPRIINTSSGAGNFASVAIHDIASYRVSKFALNGLTMSWAQALKGQVAVNAFDPGWVKTDMGGPAAPGTVDESAQGALALVSAPFDVTGKFWKDGREIPW
jgi:NAD(P)-dependent dehydrogenase (short-subunit alcohol dehydrogenase family)